MVSIYDPDKAREILKINAGLDIPEEDTALAYARECGFEEPMQQALRKRRDYENLALILDCISQIGTVKSHSDRSFQGDYLLLLPNGNRAFGLYADLREVCIAENNPHQPKVKLPDGREVYRACTVLENVLARVTDFNTINYPNGNPRCMGDRLRFFKTGFNSSCAIAYKAEKGNYAAVCRAANEAQDELCATAFKEVAVSKAKTDNWDAAFKTAESIAKTGKFKLDLQSPDLMSLPHNFNREFKPIDYAQIEGQELDRSKAKYDTPLTKEEVLQHPAWLTLLEGDRALLRAYRDFVFTQGKEDEAMAFWLSQTPEEQDELRPVCIGSLGDNSNAYGYDHLLGYGQFLRRSPFPRCNL